MAVTRKKPSSDAPLAASPTAAKDRTTRLRTGAPAAANDDKSVRKPRVRSPRQASEEVEVASAPPVVVLDPKVVDKARSITLTKNGIAELSRFDVAQLQLALRQTLSARDGRTATTLALALAAAGETLDAAIVARLLPDVDQRDLIPPLLRACCTTDSERLAIMQQAIERGELSHDREAIVMFIASQLLGEAPWPSPWRGLVRTLSRQMLGEEAGVLLGLVIQKSGDESALLVGEELVELAEKSNSDEISEFWLDGWNKPVLEILPDTEPPRVVAGYTVRRSQDRLGRNDPCHCGSGKKYKKCCALKDDAQERGGEQPHVDFSKVTATDVEGMRIQEVLALPFAQLHEPALRMAVRQLRAYHRWEDAERALEILSETEAAGRPGNETEDLREQLIEEALRMRAIDVIDRELEKVQDRESLQARVRAGIACAMPSAETLSVLDAQARRGLAGDIDAIADVAYSLLDHAPALGVLVARGALDPERPNDSNTLLEEIEYARDRLEIAPGDPFGPLYDEWVEGRKSENAQNEAAKSELARVRHELERAESELNDQRARHISMEREIRELREHLARMPKLNSGSPEAQLQENLRHSEEARRAQNHKIDELKALLKESNHERHLLREQLERSQAQERDRHSESPLESAEMPALEVGDEGVSAVDADTTVPIRIPSFTRKAIEALRTMPAKVQRSGVSMAGRLAGADRAAWREVKRMQGMEGVWTARLGIHHRLIFQVDEERLEVKDVVTREALLTSLERYR